MGRTSFRSWFLAADFERAAWREDVSAFATTCADLGVPVAIERSRSGNGANDWFFLSSPVSASEARRMASFLITETMSRWHELSMESYDRLFPNQDTMPRGGFGNLKPFRSSAHLASVAIGILLTALIASDAVGAPAAVIVPLRFTPKVKLEELSEEGLETHVLEGVPVRITRPARTVADRFKYRNKIGIDVVVEALKVFTHLHRGGANELARYAKVGRVNRVMTPYMDAIA